MTQDEQATEVAAESVETVQTLTPMIKDLEQQLDRMLAINDGTEKELERERVARGEAERTVGRLEEKLERAEQRATVFENQRAEVKDLEAERTKLAANIESLGRQLSDTEQESRKLVRDNEQLQSNRDDAIEDLQAVEAQFARAMQIIKDLRTRLDVLGDERNALLGELELQKEKTRGVVEERDHLQAEADESRTALEEIRRSLSDAYRSSGAAQRDQ